MYCQSVIEWDTDFLQWLLIHPESLCTRISRNGSFFLPQSRKGCGWAQTWLWTSLSGTCWRWIIITLLHHISSLWFIYRKYTESEGRMAWRHRGNTSYVWRIWWIDESPFSNYTTLYNVLQFKCWNWTLWSLVVKSGNLSNVKKIFHLVPVIPQWPA